MKKIYHGLKCALILFICVVQQIDAQHVSTFENFPLEEDSYWNGISKTYGSWTSIKTDSIFQFENHFSRADYGYGLFETWDGFAYSRMKDDTTAGFANQYSAITTMGADSSENYAVYFLGNGKDTVWLTEPTQLDSVWVTNSTYAYLTMKNGDMFTDAFGADSLTAPDWFLLTIRGLNDGLPTDTIDIYLADFRFENNDDDYIIDEWTNIDLSALGMVDMLELSLSSSDTGAFGMNTPAYFCMDNLSGADFEEFTYVSGDYWNGKTASFGAYPSSFSDGIGTFSNIYTINDFGFGPFESWTGFAYSNMTDDTTKGFNNQYSAYPAEGADGSENYGLCFNGRGRDTISLSSATELTGAYFTNGTYNYFSMLEGDGFAKKFGGETGNDPDWFLLTIRGVNDGNYTDSVLFYLADYRFDNNDKDYIVGHWQWVDFTSLGTVDMVEFSLSSSDMGDFGMNTPAYFFMDDFNAVLTDAEPESLSADGINIFPNPFAFAITVEGNIEISSIRILDITGKVVEQYVNLDGKQNIYLNLQHLESGLYFIQVEGADNKIVKRIIKK